MIYDNRTDEEIEFDERLEDAYWEREDEKNADDYLDDVFFESDFFESGWWCIS